jgi:hypothetical protein
MRRILLAFTLVALCPLTSLADNVSYSLEATNFGTIGDFGWTVTFPTFIGPADSIFTKSWNAIQEPTNGLGCKITEILIFGQGGGSLRFDAFFAPLCQGKFDGVTLGFPVPDSTFGVFVRESPNFDDNGNPNGVLRIELDVFPSNLPVTTPEPASLELLCVGLAVGVWRLRRS